MSEVFEVPARYYDDLMSSWDSGKRDALYTMLHTIAVERGDVVKEKDTVTRRYRK